METYLVDWISLIVRWLHVITGIAWIGASFYFMWLDNSLEDPPQWKKDKGIKGDLWAVHGGGIYEVAKYQGAPEKMPEHLHWFKWEAYSTWLTGMVLLAVIYYLGAESYLIDRRVADLSQGQAIVLGLAFLVGSWVAYTVLCLSPLAKNGWLLAVVLLILGGGLAWGLSQLFSGRGAYIHFGAIIGTIMVGNVFQVIMPGQRKLVAALESGDAPNPQWGARAKLRSTHNTYLTLPLLFIMISNHYPMTYGHSFNWAILLALVVITAVSRQYFVLRHMQINRPAILGAAMAATVVLAVVIAPKPAVIPDSGLARADLATRAHGIIRERCTSCHAANPSDDVFTTPPGGVMLDTVEQMQQWSPRIKARSIDSHDMPFMNKTNMTDEERGIVAQWIEAEGAVD
ncbi:urate hydroxylase PuuD [Congregibacter litoralis]|uniref:Putative membrane protein n=1 Tax=Congregibacter litoralis KT71 TaxID=314285 RepID=A4A383_9GAMM|nr:urate hydroxylase PuuD [Congregibacter litoralis]EAQ99156.1 putative membrane protein [Congregibacter litoralis KT71]